MDLLRHSKDPFGQKMLVGVSWDVLWVPVIAAFAVIAVHLLWRWRRRRSNTTANGAHTLSEH